MWEVEPIPDGDKLFIRVHKQNLLVNNQGKVVMSPGALRKKFVDPGLSVDWSRYATPEETRARTGKAELYGVKEAVVGDVRAIASTHVEHAPIQAESGELGNRAHSQVSVSFDTSLNENMDAWRIDMNEAFTTWVIDVGAPVTL